MNAPRTARARARAELTAAIKDVARRHLAEHGASGLSLRAVARELGMASSAVYRYFASRDELLTALIVDSYDSLGAAVEAADGAWRKDAAASGKPDDGDLAERWLVACRAVRRWALDNPQEYALIYGSPVPGYRAPEDTIGPATRTPVVMAAALTEAAAPGMFGSGGGVPLVPLPSGLAADMATLGPFFEGVPADAAARGIVAWSAVFGLVTFELFGQYDNVIAAREEFFDYAVRALLLMVVMPSAPG